MNAHDDERHERWLAALSIGPGIFEIVCMYSARAGRSKLINGEVEYTTDPLAFIDDDEILPCCCIPISNIEIELS